jgi:hypothetical protein
MFTFIITLSVTFAVGLMLAWHLFLVFTNQTTIEFYFNQHKKAQAKEIGQVSKVVKNPIVL